MILIKSGFRRPGRLLASAAAIALCLDYGGAALAVPPKKAVPPRSAGCLPHPAWGNVPSRSAPIRPVRNLITVDRAGSIYWNGSRIDEAMLSRFLAITATMNPVPQAHLEVDPAAPCDLAARIVSRLADTFDCTRSCRYAVTPWQAYSSPPPPAPPAPPVPPRPPRT